MGTAGCRLPGAGCYVCREPLSPCPSPAIPPDLFSTLAPVVCRSVLLSATYPHFTRQKLELKLKNGDIGGVTRCKSSKWLSRREEEENTERRPLPPLAAPEEQLKASYGFFSNLADLQRQLESGRLKWNTPAVPREQIKSVAPLLNSRSTRRNFTIFNNKTSNKTRSALFPPILDVWEQNDAMQRSLRLCI